MMTFQNNNSSNSNRNSNTLIFGVRPTPLLLLILLASPGLVKSACECGYSVTVSGSDRSSSPPVVFTDLVETNFATSPQKKEKKEEKEKAGQEEDADAAAPLITDWIRQEFNTTTGRAPYRQSFQVANVNLFADEVPPSGWREGPVDDAMEAGLWLRVGSAVKEAGIDENDGGIVPGGEVSTARRDLGWGSYRAGMKLTAEPGTCAAFFWYFNDTQEIDMEFLSRQFDRSRSIYPVNLVLQSDASRRPGYDAAKAGNLVTTNLAFDPTSGFHEYRIDYLPHRVVFYADDEVLAEMTGGGVPTAAGHLMLSHWSNGDPFWSGGPPSRDALLAVGWVKAYFNSTTSTTSTTTGQRHGEQGEENRCKVATEDGTKRGEFVCVVPDRRAGGFGNGAAAADDGGWFFTGNEDDMMEDQAGRNRAATIALMAIVAATAAMIVAIVI